VTAFVVVVATVMGLLIGSFLNVVIGRVPNGESIVQPPSHCPKCGTTLRAYDNIPVLSWIVLGRKCRTCRAPISAQYPLVEAGTAVLFALVAWRVGAHADLPALLIAAAAFVSLSVIDLQTKRLPDLVVFPSLAMTAVGLVAAAIIDDRFGDLGRAGIGAAIGFGALFVIHVAKPNGMGFGDVKLAALCGLVLGWFGLADLAVGLYAGFVLGAAVGVALMVVGRVRRGVTIPFGPFLAAGTMLTILALGSWADWLRDLYA
jgi:leader peptidase (prepilin peptidase)/N-methyltransferase